MAKVNRRNCLYFALLISAGAALPTFAAERYAHPEMLVETGWVAEHGRDANVRLVDARASEAYAAGHIPGAVAVAEGPLKNADDRETYLPSPADFRAMMERAGISSHTRVVIYDDQGGKSAARLWYVLNAYGHGDVALVNGGWKKWSDEKRPVSMKADVTPAGHFVPRLTHVLTCRSSEVLARKPGVIVLDTRSPGEHEGSQISPGAKKAGRIPGSVNVDWRENVTGPDLVFKSAEELERLYASQGVTRDREIISHCASGGRAAQTLFTLKLMGYPKVRIYYGSFADYTGRPEAPVEK